MPALARKCPEMFLSSFNRARRGVRGKLKETKSQTKPEIRDAKSEIPFGQAFSEWSVSSAGCCPQSGDIDVTRCADGHGGALNDTKDALPCQVSGCQVGRKTAKVMRIGADE
jgi:hypothetical protein